MKLDLPAFAVRRWQLTLVAFGLLVLLGVNAFRTVPRSEDPHFPIPYVVVRAVMPGAQPAEFEQLVVKPIEAAVYGLDDIDKVESVSQDGSGRIWIYFTWNVDPERKYDQVVREVNAIRQNLPDGLTDLDIQRVRTTEVAVVQAALLSDTLPMRRFEKIAARLCEQLGRVSGVREARYWGAPKSEVQITLDLARLAAMKLPAAAVPDALAAAGAEAPIGTVHAGERRFNVRSGGAFRDLDSIGDTPVRPVAGQVIRVRDVAAVAWAQEEPSHLTRLNGKRALFITVTQRDGQNVGTITAGVNRVFDEYRKALPAGVKLQAVFDQSRNVEHRLDNLYRDFILALAIVLVTLLPLGIRAGAIVMISIPLSLLIGLALLQSAGFTLNQLSVAGFVLALGLLVDDSIVVVENIARRIRSGADRTTAAINGMHQIGLAVLGCTATLMLAFLPLMALPGGSGAYIRSLPVSVLFTIGASLFVSLTIVPFLASRMLANNVESEGNRLLQVLNRGIQRFYHPALTVALARPWLALAMTFVLCATALPLFKLIGTSLFPPAETPQFMVRIQTPDGSSLAKTDEALRFVDSRLSREPDVIWRADNLGRGNPQVFYNRSQRESSNSLAEIFASFETWRPGRSDAVLDNLRRDFSRFPGAKISVDAFQNGPPIETPIAVRITGQDLGILETLAQRAEAIVKATPGTRDVDNPMRLDRTDLDLGVDDAKAAALGVSPGAARRIARLALSGEESGRFRDSDGDDYPVTVRLPTDKIDEAARTPLSVLQSIYVPAADDNAVPLSAISTLVLRSSPSRIDHFDRERTVTVTANVRTGYLTSDVTREVFDRVNRSLETPPGYRVSLGGQAEAQSESFSGIGAAMLIAIGGILAVLVLEFRKFKTALVVAGVIPLGIFGAILALAITGNSLSFTAMVGLVALIGIEIKNSILLVDLTEHLRAEGTPLRDAIERAGEVRFLPVLLTSVTAIGGLLPLAVERSSLYSPLAIAIIGGLLVSTLLSRIATPVMYWLIARREEDEDIASNHEIRSTYPEVPA